MIQVTEVARKKIEALMKDQEEQKKTKIEGLCLTVKGAAAKTEYCLAFVEAGRQKAGDVITEAGGLKLFMEPLDASFLEEVKIDFITTSWMSPIMPAERTPIPLLTDNDRLLLMPRPAD